jgi:hypothetical protein
MKSLFDSVYLLAISSVRSDVSNLAWCSVDAVTYMPIRLIVSNSVHSSIDTFVCESLRDFIHEKFR